MAKSRWLFLCLTPLFLSCRSGGTVPVAKFARVNGVRLQYLDWGGNGTGLVFIHGLGDSPHAFDDIAPAFRDQFRVIAYARRAHGRSEVKGPYDHATLVEDLRQLLDTLGIPRVVLVGWSLGGNELSEFAARYPDRVGGLVFLECYDYGTSSFAQTLAHFPIAFTPQSQDLVSKDAFRRWWQSVATPNAPLTQAMEAEIADLTTDRADGSVRVVTNDSITSAFFRSAMSYRLPYASLHAPILAMWGHWYRDALLPTTAPDSLRRRVDVFLHEYGRPLQDSALARLRAAVPTARLVMLDSASHAIFPFQNRDTITAEMREFVRTLRN